MENAHSYLNDLLNIDEFPIGRLLLPVLGGPTGCSARGYAYLQEDTYHHLRDRVPHLLGMGQRVMACLDHVEDLLSASPASVSPESLEHCRRAVVVVRAVVRTAAITAPSDLWLLRHVLTRFQEQGLSERLTSADGCTLNEVEALGLLPEEVGIDLNFLLSRGLLNCEDGRYGAAGSREARAVWSHRWSSLPRGGARLSVLWSRAFMAPQAFEGWDLLTDVVSRITPVTTLERETWGALPEEIELGYGLLPMALGMHASGVASAVLETGDLRREAHGALPELVFSGCRDLLCAAGILRAAPEPGGEALTKMGRRVLERGMGPFGIIEAYHSYMASLPAVWREGKGRVAVSRETNIAASQLANARSFERVNDAIDRFCEDTGHPLRVYVEHALGRGEASRQRFGRLKERDLETSCLFVGADLEDAAVDAALAEQAAGRLPAGMHFIRGADIARPELLLLGMEAAGVPTEGSFMVVGNGFHEARCVTDDRMVEVFSGYHDAGLIVVFTEESALSDEDLLGTAWNTYHAGFRYVHCRSGQVLRPADPGPVPLVGAPLRSSWTECAGRAGYVRAEAYCSRTRTIFPFRPAGGRNPAISVNHFMVPGPLAARLGVTSETATS